MGGNSTPSETQRIYKAIRRSTRSNSSSRYSSRYNSTESLNQFEQDNSQSNQKVSQLRSKPNNMQWSYLFLSLCSGSKLQFCFSILWAVWWKQEFSPPHSVRELFIQHSNSEFFTPPSMIWYNLRFETMGLNFHSSCARKVSQSEEFGQRHQIK